MQKKNEILEDFNSENSERHILAKPPKEAYFYFPKPDEIVIHDPQNPTKTLRRLFEGNVVYLKFEQEKLTGFKQYISNYEQKKNSQKVEFPDYWRDHDTLRCLQARAYDYEKTLENLLPHLDFRKIYIPTQLSDKTVEVLNTGFLYSHGRDNRFRPIIVIRAAIFKKNLSKYSYEDWERAIVYFMEYNIKNLLIPGQIENWNTICDLDDCSVMTLPSEFTRILNMITANYRCRLFVMYILNLSIFLRAIWQVVKLMLDPVTQKKIQIVQPGAAEMFTFIHPSQIETRFGGKAKEIQNSFFPHIRPSEQYFVDSDKINDILISEEQYRKKIENDPKIVQSPHLDYSPEINFQEEPIIVTDVLKTLQHAEEIKEESNKRSSNGSFIFNEDNNLNIESEMDSRNIIQKKINLKSMRISRKPKIEIRNIPSDIYSDFINKNSDHSSATTKNECKSSNSNIG